MLIIINSLREGFYQIGINARKHEFMWDNFRLNTKNSPTVITVSTDTNVYCTLLQEENVRMQVKLESLQEK